jgi:5-methylcytosine-specific restriction endonuclease McrA
MPEFSITPQDCWRGIIFLGLNTATYKLALANCLIQFVEHGQTSVTMNELSASFFDLYLARLQAGAKPQLILPHRLTVMERIVEQYRSQRIDRDGAVLRVKNEAFGDVIPRFHTVDNVPVPTQFYIQTPAGLTVTDDAFAVLIGANGEQLRADIDTRWSLLEAAFEIRRENFQLENDIRMFYLNKGYERTNITHLRPALNGYQNNLCFYCGLPMQPDEVDVDHVIPRQLIYHDEVWNLVLAHTFCNMQKSDLPPSMYYIEQLVYRNEFLIASNHPLKDKIIQQLGATPGVRRQVIQRVYSDALRISRFTWEGVRGYNPRTDPLYRLFVQNR